MSLRVHAPVDATLAGAKSSYAGLPAVLAGLFQVCNNLLRLKLLVFHLVTIANQSDPVDNDLVVHTNARLDDKQVVQFILDDNLALMCHIVFVDHVNVPLVENFKSRPLRDDDGVILHLADQHGAGLAMTQQAFRVRKVRAESDVSGH